MANELHKNILIICNPKAGKGKAQRIAEKLTNRLQSLDIPVGRIVTPCSVQSMQDFHRQNANNIDGYSLIIIIGGDGTIGPIVDAMIKNNINVPIYAFGRGTANDFARFFKTNKSIRKSSGLIAKAIKPITIDTIKVDMPNNELDVHYAISDAAGGAFTNGVTRYNKTAKRIFGKLAYLFTAAWKSLFIKSQNVRFTVDGQTFEEDILLFYILNTRNVGGLKNTCPVADPTDGELDLMCIKKCGFFGKIGVGLSLLFGRLHKSKRVIHKRGKNFYIEVLGGKVIHNFTKTDTDGNVGGDYPLTVQVGPKITVISNHPNFSK